MYFIYMMFELKNSGPSINRPSIESGLEYLKSATMIEILL